ncbi:MAG: hypothetical protein JO235_06485 [Chroococcidiopsidaceae cyanobacterium CP_BM_RX_35]|nr:hypothetical protein [Chroococcidiopsidaceae cyanobacterium CP_BM_RX_35]
MANDVVYDQLIALLNSIEATLGAEFPVCICPYDARTERITAAIADRSNVQLLTKQSVIEKWDNFAHAAWNAHPTAKQRWQQLNSSSSYYRFGTHRRFCAFDGPFEQFIYMDADTLLLSPVEPIFQQLKDYDWVTYDFQHKDPTHVYDLSSPNLTKIFPQTRINSEIFCSGFYASKRHIFDESKREFLLNHLREGEAEILYYKAPDQTLLNYMVMRTHLSYCNLALQLPTSKVTGCCVTSKHFKVKDNLVYDRGQRLTYLHYIGITGKVMQQVCEGENLNFPYRDIFLHYRYLHEPDQCPRFTSPGKLYYQSPSLWSRILRKIKLIH